VLIDQLLEPFVEHVSVDLGGGDIGVSEQFLDSAQIGATGQQMACKGMAQHMGRDLRNGDAGAPGNLLELPGKDLPGEMAFRRIGRKQEACVFGGVADCREPCVERRAPGRDIGTMRSLAPLPRMIRNRPSSASTLKGRLTSSLTRMPVA
jgi:hypothetical protein